MSSRKAQAFSIDLMVSVGVFVAVLVVASFAWNSAQEKIGLREQQETLMASADDAADLLLKSPGYPADWTPATVSSIGLAVEHRVLSPFKFMKLKEVDYEQAAYLLGLGGYNFTVGANSNGSSVLSGVLRSPVAYFTAGGTSVFEALDLSGLVWDYYSPSIADAGDSRNQFQGGTAQERMQELLSNALDYDSIIIQDSGLPASQVNQTALKEFLNRGGLLAVVGESGNSELFLNESLGVRSEKNASDSAGAVVDPSFFLYNVSAGDNVSFASSKWRLSSWLDSFTVFVSRYGAPASCLACAWDYGAGKIFYLAEYNASFYTANGVKEESEVLNLAGWPMTYGFQPIYYSEAMVSNRLALLSAGRSRPVSLSVVVFVG